jgi:triosephosphate isomerase (TIM)
MNRKKIVAGNWKMNTTWIEAFDLVSTIKEKAKSENTIHKIVFPPFPFLQMCNVIFDGEPNFFVGAQNCSEHLSGAYTGEVSTAMIRSAGCEYVLIGHSERRTYFKETSEQLIQKIDNALVNNLKVIFCFGEQLSDRKNENHFSIVENQLKEVIGNFNSEAMQSFVLAYEPVWAIGTGETASPEQAQEMHAFIRQTVAQIFNADVAEQMSILYGGSCNAKNAAHLFAGQDVDGGLIGGASLKADDFYEIIKALT